MLGVKGVKMMFISAQELRKTYRRNRESVEALRSLGFGCSAVLVYVLNGALALTLVTGLLVGPTRLTRPPNLTQPAPYGGSKDLIGP